ASGFALPRALHLPGVHHALPDHRPARLRASRHRLCPAREARGEQVAQALSRLLPQPRRLSRGLHAVDRQAPGRGPAAELAAHRRLLVSARRHADRCVLPDGAGAGGRVDSRSGCCPLPGTRVRAGEAFDPHSARQAIRERALAAGFDAVGFVAPASAEAQAHLDEFLARGWHGDMAWMARNAERRGTPAALWPELRAIVSLGLNYGPGDDPLA